MNSTNELTDRINSKYSRMSKSQKRLADHVLENYERAVFLTAEKLGGAVGVSESTVVRFAACLGYHGYPDFQRALEQMIRHKLNSVQRMEATYGRINQTRILETVLHSDAEKIRHTLEKIDQAAFERALDLIVRAKCIYVIGVRNCAPLSGFLAFYLNFVFDHVKLLQTNSPAGLFEQMVRIGKDDVIIGISFPRYSMRTLKALEFASDRNAGVITLTDSPGSPVCRYSTCNLIAESDIASIVDSLVAPLSVINALFVALCRKKPRELVDNLETLESVWEEYGER